MTAQPEALRLADAIEKAIRPEASLPLGDWARAAAELRRLHAENASLAAALAQQAAKDLHPLLGDVRFNGADYVPERDNARLAGQFLRVCNVVSNGAWYTLKEISQKTGDPEASVSAQLRHLRKDRFGGHTVERKHIQMGLYKYRVILNSSKAVEETK